jgi:hypothetical protein
MPIVGAWRQFAPLGWVNRLALTLTLSRKRERE